MDTLFCCDTKAVWVENIPGKGYNFCTKCRKEVLKPLQIINLDEIYGTTDQKNYHEEDENLDDIYDLLSSLTKGVP